MLSRVLCTTSHAQHAHITSARLILCHEGHWQTLSVSPQHRRHINTTAISAHSAAEHQRNQLHYHGYPRKQLKAADLAKSVQVQQQPPIMYGSSEAYRNLAPEVAFRSSEPNHDNNMDRHPRLGQSGWLA